MTMRATTVRFSEDLWQLLEREAARDGVSAAQFVRDATLLRIGNLAGRRRDPATQASVRELAECLTRQSRRPAVAAPERLKALRETGLLDSAPEAEFDRLTALVRRVLNAPVALISLVDDQRQFFKSQDGLPEPLATERQTPLSHSFCQYVVRDCEPLIVSDAREHPVLRDNPAVSELGVIAYAGIPLVVGGHALGSLCAVDYRPRLWTTDQIEVLADLANLTVTQITVACVKGSS